MLRQTYSVSSSIEALVPDRANSISARPSSEPGKPFDINVYIPALEKLNQTIQETTVLVGAVDQRWGPMVQRLVTEINTAAEKRVDHVFWMLFLLFAHVGAIGVGLVFLHHRMKRRDHLVMSK